MTQNIPDKVVEMLVNPTAPLAAQQAGIDLLSLRAAVRRWISESKKAQKAHFTTYDFSDYDAACAALIAEMGGIDKDEGGKP